jgi:lipopolysaccharide export system permease protein
VAATARQEQDSKSGYRFLVLENGVRYEGVPGDPAYRVIEFESYSIRLLPDLVPEPPVPLRGWRNQDLWQNYNRPWVRSELHWRLSKVVVLPVLILFALGFGHISPGRGRLPAIMGALVIYFCYTNVAGLAVATMRNSTALFPVIGLWILHLVFAVAAIYLFWCKTVNRSLLSLRRTPARS